MSLGTSAIDPALRSSSSQVRDVPDFTSPQEGDGSSSMKFEGAESAQAYHSSNSTTSFPPTTEYPESSAAEYAPSAAGLSALASAASDQTSYIRAYDNADNSNNNHNASQSVNYATSAATATNGGHGSTTANADANNQTTPRSDATTPYGYARASRKLSPGRSDGSNSPVSRTDTPNFHGSTSIPPHNMFDNVGLADPNFTPSGNFASLQLQHPSPGSTSSNERHLDGPQTYENLVAANTSLKTRVNELELINDLFQDSESRLRQSLKEAQKREEELKRRISELEGRLSEQELGQSKDEPAEPHAKRCRLSDSSEKAGVDSKSSADV
ncbi:hypothetical protein McanMca71_004435 [Microsporum canis]|uniref:GATA transcription factor n=1 Tax=Arthroderma otae (strain ATCC MYA-4605 / CBS 113480) TaxID=554155 RepID=C5FPE2_ARTOC|nr:GATA transcription factor [Microsporum canis CBS 113480]EEQ31458.1 GATA transcription factor [Microsporum canis CBS 113480]